ncbi:MAG: glycosyltransferase, partial [Tumebacillaceae bacterium]
YDPVDRVIVQHMLEDKLHVLHAGYERSKRKLRVVYTGTFNGHEAPPADHQQSPYYLLLAVQKLRARMPELASRLEVVFAGKTTSRELVSELGLEDIVTFLGHRSYEETLKLQGSADLLLLFVGPANRHVLTGKVFEYMATGRPILAMIPTGTELHDLLHDYGSATVTETKNVDAIAARLGEFVTGTVPIGEANEPFLESLSRAKQASMLAAILEDASR